MWSPLHGMVAIFGKSTCLKDIWMLGLAFRDNACGNERYRQSFNKDNDCEDLSGQPDILSPWTFGHLLFQMMGRDSPPGKLQITCGIASFADEGS